MIYGEMIYIVIEIQISKDGVVSIVPPSSFSNRDEAEHAYHTALAAASISHVYTHSVAMLNGVGDRIKGETYRHGAPVPNEE